MDIEDDALMEEVRKVLRQLLGEVEPEPENSAVVPNEGRSTGAPRITDDQRARDFLRRINGTTPTFADRLPED